MLIKTKSAQSTKEYGQKLAQKVKKGGIICLYGPLGAGKTTLVQGIAIGLGIKKRIVSPTFIIVRKYLNFWHIDLYRLNDVSSLGLQEILEDPKNIVVIEWPEKIKNILPKHYIEIKIKTLGEEKREIYETIY